MFLYCCLIIFYIGIFDFYCGIKFFLRYALLADILLFMYNAFYY